MDKEKLKEELKQLAIDVLKGRVWTSAHSPTDPFRAFTYIQYLSQEELNKFWEKDPFILYEYMDKAGERTISIGGITYPSFSSFKFLNRDEAKIFTELYQELTTQKYEE